MNKCKTCGSYAINETQHGREKGVDLDLCDVCYWRKRATDNQQSLSDRVMVAKIETHMNDRFNQVRKL